MPSPSSPPVGLARVAGAAVMVRCSLTYDRPSPPTSPPGSSAPEHPTSARATASEAIAHFKYLFFAVVCIL